MVTVSQNVLVTFIRKPSDDHVMRHLLKGLAEKLVSLMTEIKAVESIRSF